MRLRLLAAATAAALAALAFPAAAQADHSWGGYHWARTSNPFTLKLADNVTSTWDSHLATSVVDWSQSSVLDLTVIPGAVNPKTCKATAGIVQVCNARYGNNGWLGIAGISITGGTHITQAYTKMNDSYFDTAQYNTPAWRNLVMCQEIAHAFGLGHQDEAFDNPNLGSCMDYTNSPGTNQHPNQHDYDQIVSIYSHLDSFTTVGQSLPSTTPATVGDSPSSWGHLVAGSAKTGFGVYLRDFGQGNMFITHVFWAQQ